MYHEKIDHLLDTYARKLAENMNQGFAIDARVPSVMIAGPANFPVRQKEKQNRARDGNMEEWRHIQGLLDKIRSTGMGGISADDPAAVEKLQKKHCLPFSGTPGNSAKKQRLLLLNLRFSGFLEPFGCGLHDNKLFFVHGV